MNRVVDDIINMQMRDWTGEFNERRKQNRLNNDITQYLMLQYEKNSDWSKEYIMSLSKKLGMTNAKIYKWHWDFSKKSNKKMNRTSKNDKL